MFRERKTLVSLAPCLRCLSPVWFACLSWIQDGRLVFVYAVVLLHCTSICHHFTPGIVFLNCSIRFRWWVSPSTLQTVSWLFWTCFHHLFKKLLCNRLNFHCWKKSWWTIRRWYFSVCSLYEEPLSSLQYVNAPVYSGLVCAVLIVALFICIVQVGHQQFLTSSWTPLLPSSLAPPLPVIVCFNVKLPSHDRQHTNVTSVVKTGMWWLKQCPFMEFINFKGFKETIKCSLSLLHSTSSSSIGCHGGHWGKLTGETHSYSVAVITPRELSHEICCLSGLKPVPQ